MAQLQDIDRWVFGFELWKPARIAEYRLVMGHEATHRGRLMALRSEVYAPGPFDYLTDVSDVAHRFLETAALEVLGSPTDDSA